MKNDYCCLFPFLVAVPSPPGISDPSQDDSTPLGGWLLKFLLFPPHHPHMNTCVTFFLSAWYCASPCSCTVWCRRSVKFSFSFNCGLFLKSLHTEMFKLSITGVKLSKPHTAYLKWVHSNLFQTCPGLPTNVRINQSQNPQNVLLYASVLPYNWLILRVQIFAKVVSNFQILRSHTL